MNMLSCLWKGDPHRLFIDFDKHQLVSVSFSSQKPSETPQLTAAVKSRSRLRLNALASSVSRASYASPLKWLIANAGMQSCSSPFPRDHSNRDCRKRNSRGRSGAERFVWLRVSWRGGPRQTFSARPRRGARVDILSDRWLTHGGVCHNPHCERCLLRLRRCHGALGERCVRF